MQSGVKVVPESMTTMCRRVSATSKKVRLEPSKASDVMCAKPPPLGMGKVLFAARPAVALERRSMGECD
jgi:hypothetical protein